MYNITDFIMWALTHVEPDTVPAKAVLPLPVKNCGTKPWHYLFGTIKVRTTRDKIEERWRNYYRSHGWTKAQYDAATKGWKDSDFATDCQGLLDAFLTYECGEKTDINAHMNYTNWCAKKGKITDIERSYVIGEAVFMVSATGKMSHVGWICGFDVDGEPLVVEARGLWYGVVITRFEDRPWTHRGLMTRKFSYKSEENDMATKFEVTSPMRTGSAYKAMQKALNAAGYRDNDSKKLSEDGKWGAKSQAAFYKLLEAHGQAASGGDAKHKIAVSVDGQTVYSTEV